jgi:carbon-monoxide dehydrogenase large subunit
VETRLENMQTTTHGRGQVAELEAAVQQDGTITALRMRIVGDLGAYPCQNFTPGLTSLMAVGVYRILAVDIESVCVLTNTVPVAAYRGAGRPEAAYYIERLIDRIAGELAMEPVEVRRKNFIPPDQFPYHAPTHLTYDSGEYDLALTKVLEIAHYAELRAEQARRGANADRLLGIGIASYVEFCAPGPYESAVVRVEPSGTVTVFTGISPHGQGQETTFSQIVADQIGAAYDQIIVRHGDTATMPMGIGTYGSRGLAVGGAALHLATVEVRNKALKIAAHILEAAPEDMVLERQLYHVRGVPDRGLTLAQVAGRAYSDELPDDIASGLEATSFFRPPSPVFPFGAHVAVVEIERETGIIHLRSYFSVDDCGKRISPQLVEGQIHGGLAQGIAQALWEEVRYDDRGQLLTSSLLDYALPRADCFPTFVTDQTETPTPHNPLGVKGIGEAATIGSTPAVVNAVMDALKPFGVRHMDMPLRPAKIWRAMRGENTESGASLPPALFNSQ